MEDEEQPENKQEITVSEPEKAEQKAEEPKKKMFEFKKPKKKSDEPGRIKKKVTQWKRTLEVAKKPGKEEYLSSLKISAFGIILIGVIGFIIYILYHVVTA